MKKVMNSIKAKRQYFWILVIFLITGAALLTASDSFISKADDSNTMIKVSPDFMTWYDKPAPYYATHSSQAGYAYGFAAFFAFDGKVTPSNGWISGHFWNPNPEWMCINLGSPTAVDMYKMYNVNSGTPDIESYTSKAFTFEGSNDGVTWDILDTVEDRQIEPDDSHGIAGVYASVHYLDKRAVYQYYRLVFPPHGFSASGLAHVGELEFWAYENYREPVTVKKYKNPDLLTD